MPNPFRMLTLSGFLLVTVLGFSNAQAAVIVNGATNGTTSVCLDVQGVNIANFTPLIAHPCHAFFNQQWDFEGFVIQGLGSYGVTNSTRKCVDVRFGGTADGTPVVLYDCHPGPIQQWYFYNGQLVNINSGKCLDFGNGADGPADGTQATIRTCNGSAGQRWVIR